MTFGPSGPNTTALQETEQNLAMPLGGIPYVPTAYAYTTSATGVALTSADHWLAYPVLPDVDYALSSLSAYKTAVVDADALATIALYSDNAGVPGTLLETLGTVTVGADAGWFRKAFATAYQKQRGVRLWTVIKGQAAKSFTIGVNRWREAILSAFPDGVLTSTGNCAMSTTDGGSNWTAVTIDSKPAMVLAVENSTTHHSPQLMWCRKNGAYDYCDGIQTIPAAGITLDCESLTADTFYYLYRYGTTLEASTTGPVVSSGMEVKADALTHRFVGVLQPTAVVGAYVAPVDTMRYRGIAYRGMRKSIGVLCPYGGGSNVEDVVSSPADADWSKWNDADDFTCQFVSMPSGAWYLTTSLRAAIGAAYAVHTTVGVNGVPSGAANPPIDNAMSWSVGGLATRTYRRSNISAQLHTIYQVKRALAAGGLELWYPDRSDHASVLGELTC